MRCSLGLLGTIGLAACSTQVEVGRTCSPAAEPLVAQECPLETAAAPCAGPFTVDVRSLLAEMPDLARVPHRACPRYTTHEASSRDLRSVTVEEPTHSLEGWFANLDWGNYLRAETMPGGRVEQVMMDVAGPGAIVRIWSANGNGTLRIYLDDSPTPAIEENFEALLSGRVPPWRAPFSAVTSSGKNLEYPIPFAQHVKVTVEGDAWAYFYQVTYRLYEPGTQVRTFTRDQVVEEDMLPVGEALEGRAPADEAGTVETCVRAREQEVVLAAEPGGSEITEIVVEPSDRSAHALRQTVLSLTFDGRETTRVPLGDFFGAGPGFRPHRTLPVEVTSGGHFVSRFVMPYRCSAVVRVGGLASQSTRLSVRHRPATFTSDTYHFFAHWIAREVPTRPFRDVRIAEIEGAGAYVGTMLAMDSRAEVWWGEGDEKIRVDGEAFPSWFGTGTEDYFGYALSTHQPFAHPYRSLSRTGSRIGQVSPSRFHVMDSIPFQSSLTFDLELIHYDETITVFYDTMAYFYAAPGARNRFPLAAAPDFRLP